MIAKSFKNKFAILILSCDKYADLWPIFFELFWRYWPDCPLNIYLITNKLSISDNRVRCLCMGEDISWSDNLIKALKSVNEEYIMLFVDDTFLIHHVNTKKIIFFLHWMYSKKINYLRLMPSPKPDIPYNNYIGEISKGSIYRASIPFSVWRKNILLDLLVKGESAWAFEVYGSIRSDKYEDFYSCRLRNFTYIHGVIKGKWSGRAVRRLRSMGFKIDVTKRDIMSLKEEFIWHLLLIRSRLFYMIPNKYKRQIKHFLLRGKYNYNLRS